MGSSMAVKSGREIGVDTASSESGYRTNPGSSMAAKHGREMGVDTTSSESGYLSKPGSLMALKSGREIGMDTGSCRNDYLIIPAKREREMRVDTTSSGSSYLTILGSLMAAKHLGDMVVATESSGCGYLAILGFSMAAKHGGEMAVNTISSRCGYLTIPGSSIAAKHVGEMVLATASSSCDYLAIPGSSMAAQPGGEIVVDTISSVLEGESTNFGEDDELQNYIEAANQFSAYIFERSKVEEGKNIEEIESKVITDKNTVVVEEGQVYKNKKLLKSVMSLYSFREHFQYKVLRSCPKEFALGCLDPNCKWFFRSSKNVTTNLFIVRKFYNSHTCSLNIMTGDHRQASSSVVGDCIKKKYLSTKMIYTPNDIMRDMMDDYGVSMSYEKAWRSREKALEMVRGNPEKSYQELSRYLLWLKTMNPGSLAELETTNEGYFKYLFIALEASIKGWEYCKPVIVLDGTFLRNSFGGILLTACTKDANENIFPLAFGVADSENNASWIWFFTKLREAYGARENLAIISDRHDSIAKAVKTMYPDSTHGSCVFYLLNNLKLKFKRKVRLIKEPFNKAATAYTLFKSLSTTWTN